MSNRKFFYTKEELELLYPQEIIEEGRAFYERKLATGKYNHYTERALQWLFSDCVKETAFMKGIDNLNKEKGRY